MIARRELLAVAAVIDIALHARGKPVAAKDLASRHGLAPRQLETLLRDLVRADILKGTRGPRGGYELARERRRISVGAILRALEKSESAKSVARRPVSLVQNVVVPAVEDAWAGFLSALDVVTIETLTDRAKDWPAAEPAPASDGFVI